MNRRHFSTLALLMLPAARACAHTEKAGAATPADHVTERLCAIERAARGRLGVHILDTATGARFGYRADERFLMCSTFKLLASALVLHRVDRGEETLDRRVPYTARDLMPNSPITAKHVADGGMSIGALCEATITYSDNTAANLILASYGGPAAFTAYARALGDTVTRLDRTEPALNRWRDAVSDTTSPRAMLETLQRVALGDALRPASREQLLRWLRANTTGATRLKAGLPADWTIGDKTGANGDNGTTNDIAIVWPPQRAPLLVTAYLTGARVPNARREAALAQVGALLPTLLPALLPTPIR